MTAEPTTDRVESIRRALLAWYRRDRRRLPWREDPSPWRTLVSELMLQQTRVETVVPYFERFLRRFPTPADLAAAEEDEVLTLWAGLGYYRRARALHAAARNIVSEHGGHVPDDPDRIRALPGVGEYTTAAVASIAFGLPMAVLDGNVERVVTRLFALSGRRGEGPLRRRVRHLADRLLAPDAPGDFNQAVMELGARICVSRSPSCLVCPVRVSCDSARRGDPETRPAPPIRKETVEVIRRAAIVRRAGRVLVLRRPENGRMAGMTELPTTERLVELGFEADVGERLATIHHAITNRRITQHVHAVTLARSRRRRPSDPWRFVLARELRALPLTAATVKSLTAAGLLPAGERNG